ncbi:carbonic anhydrase 15-like [Platysternon megacephalum]|uniref:Carbonic anhydrase 15-like n=1 Tax=Platysternon megacephalum TaxID=55544 RepID=A0A4D9EY88_9SAUR|nr:carbonic anhydrase 15-like [Platysternon megacephalum]
MMSLVRASQIQFQYFREQQLFPLFFCGHSAPHKGAGRGGDPALLCNSSLVVQPVQNPCPLGHSERECTILCSPCGSANLCYSSFGPESKHTLALHEADRKAL